MEKKLIRDLNDAAEELGRQMDELESKLQKLSADASAGRKSGGAMAEALEALMRELLDLSSTLADINDLFPETQKFLASRGLGSTRELDEKGWRELEDYLAERLRQLRSSDLN